MRNTHYLKLSITPKAKDTVGGAESVIVARHLIEAITPLKDGCRVYMTSGMVFDVIETEVVVMAKFKGTGVGNIL